MPTSFGILPNIYECPAFNNFFFSIHLDIPQLAELFNDIIQTNLEGNCIKAHTSVFFKILQVEPEDQAMVTGQYCNNCKEKIFEPTGKFLNKVECPNKISVEKISCL